MHDEPEQRAQNVIGGENPLRRLIARGVEPRRPTQRAREDFPDDKVGYLAEQEGPPGGAQSGQEGRQAAVPDAEGGLGEDDVHAGREPGREEQEGESFDGEFAQVRHQARGYRRVPLRAGVFEHEAKGGAEGEEGAYGEDGAEAAGEAAEGGGDAAGFVQVAGGGA